jgi:hypothetical protein
MKKIPVSHQIIQYKALSLHEEIKKLEEGSSEEFSASRWWFDYFKN